MKLLYISVIQYANTNKILNIILTISLTEQTITRSAANHNDEKISAGADWSQPSNLKAGIVKANNCKYNYNHEQTMSTEAHMDV